jgi:hypothetical protein
MQRIWEGAACSDLQQGCAQEWLLPNGVGGYASQSLLGVSTRTQHSLLMATTPEGERRSLLARLEDSFDGKPLATHQYPNAFWPFAYNFLKRIAITPSPVWVFDLGERVIARCIEVAQGRNATCITYHLLKGEPATLQIKPLFAFREQSELRHKKDGLEYSFAHFRNTLTVLPEGEPMPCVLHLGNAEFHAAPDWFFRFVYERDKEAKQPYEEDLFTPGVINIELSQEKPFSLWAVADVSPAPIHQLAPPPALEVKVQAEPKFSGPLLIARQIARRRSLIHLRDQLRESSRSFFWVDASKNANIFDSLHTPTEDCLARIIALPGLCLGAERPQDGLVILERYLKQLPEKIESQSDLWELLLCAWSVSLFPGNNAEIFLLLQARLSWLLSLDSPSLIPLYQEKESVPLRVAGLWYWSLWWLSAHREADMLHGVCEERRRSMLVEREQFGRAYQTLEASSLWAFATPKPLFSGHDARPHLDLIRQKLLTPRGLRATQDSKEITPWYLGLYTSAYLNAYGDNNAAARDHVEQSLLALNSHLERERCIGFISELFEDNEPLSPKGAVASAPNIGEVLRALEFLGIKESQI